MAAIASCSPSNQRLEVASVNSDGIFGGIHRGAGDVRPPAGRPGREEGTEVQFKKKKGSQYGRN